MTAFWDQVDDLLTSTTHVVDPPAGSPHPRYPDWVHPLDYGYPAGTTSGDGDDIDAIRRFDAQQPMPALLVERGD